jgi:hypothetical protein
MFVIINENFEDKSFKDIISGLYFIFCFVLNFRLPVIFLKGYFSKNSKICKTQFAEFFISRNKYWLSHLFCIALAGLALRKRKGGRKNLKIDNIIRYKLKIGFWTGIPTGPVIQKTFNIIF